MNSAISKDLSNSITDNFELRRLILIEFESLRTNASLLSKVLAEAYIASGGNAQNARMIWVLATEEFARRKIEKIDFPGPDALIKPRLLEIVKQLAGEAFDDFFRS